MPIKRGDRLKLVHVRSVTGSGLDPSDTGPTGFPYTGTPQLKIVDLDETVKEVLKHLRYLNALLYGISHSPEIIVFDLEHTHIWLNRTGRAKQIDLAFQHRPLAAFVLFNPIFRLPLHVVPQAHQTCNREQPVLPCIYVWSPWVPVEGPVAGRNVLVYGPQLSGKSIEDVSNILAADVIFRKESRQEMGQLVDIIRKGTVRESPEDSTFREVLLLEAVSPAAAELIVQHPYSWGFPTTTCWLPSKEVSDAVATREVAIVDRKQILLDHRNHFVQAVAEHMGKLTLNTTILKETDEVFNLHVPSRAPSVPGDPASLLQWKRNGGGYAINYYAIFTEEAYGALAKAGKQTVRVPAGVDDRGRHIITSVTLEVGRWRAKGTGTIERQTPRVPRGREEQGGRLDKIADEVACKLINKVASKASETDEDEEYRGIPYHGPKADSKKKQPPSKRQAASTDDKAARAEPPTKRRAPGVSQTSTREETQLGSPRANPPVTRKRTKEAAGLQDTVAWQNHTSSPIQREAAHPVGPEEHPGNIGKPLSQDRQKQQEK
ncbi:hypothetical protein CYMTET_25813 [Cymbomonas tetramitiformis]|uniref:Uncharacterized protein n=1 Tax=Cymbomonas tetramitiformis TaxID=36881 RepID=A0AAE0FTB2_9CHLO|nr:hypothetical protein CYMTET_25813 [Cymbomonas tetramitiformis]